MSVANSLDEWCPNCGEPTNRLNDYTGWCSDCSYADPYVQLENYLSKNADHLEHYISKGHSLLTSLLLVKGELRPSCIICGEVIPHASKKAIFCSRYATCKTACNRYHYLHKQKGFTKSQALAEIIKQFVPE